MKTQPALFISHGAPTFAIEPGAAGAQLGALARALGKPRAVVLVSPHWQTRGIQISAAARPGTIHDFGGFPRALYQIQYPAPGAPDVARRVQQVLGEAGIQGSLNEHQGLDHGAWVPLMHLFPEADVPVVQVSMPVDLDAGKAFELGRGLSTLAHEDVLVIGSGSLTHNLYEFRTGAVQEAAYAREFTHWVRQAVLEGDRDRLIGTLERAPHAQRAHPTSEHFLPLLVAFGAANDVLPATVLDGGIRHGVLAMESYVFGAEVEIEASGSHA
jgi:4,5-DOPA dioxygenase extradiol